MAILEAKNLTKHFGGVKAVDNFSVKVKEGKITGLIGPNGSGKTTLINLLSGTKSIDSGEVIINEAKKFTKIKPYQISFYGITRTFQTIRLFEQMTVLDNILVVLTKRNIFSALFSAQGGSALGGEKQQAYHLKKAEEVLKKVGLWKKKNEPAVNLSYGQRKLLEMARVLAMDKDIFLLDESFAGLFPEMRKIVSGIIKKLKQEGKTIVLIEHSMDLIRELCDYIIVMDSGKLLGEGEPDKVLENKKVVEAYLGK